jgi:hypothetical protein
LPVTYEALVLKNHAGARFFRVGSSATMKIRRKTRAFETVMPRLKLLSFSHCSTVQGHAKFDWTSTCALAVLSHFDAQWLQGTLLPGKRELLVLVFETSKHSCRDE